MMDYTREWAEQNRGVRQEMEWTAIRVPVPWADGKPVQAGISSSVRIRRLSGS